MHINITKKHEILIACNLNNCDIYNSITNYLHSYSITDISYSKMIYKCLVYDQSSVVFIVGAKQYNNEDEQIKHALKSDIIYPIHFNVFKKKKMYV